LTTEWIAEYSRNVHPVVSISAIVADLWKTEGFAESRGFDGQSRLTFQQMIHIKGRPPSRKAQFCTEILKLRPQRRWMDSVFGPGGIYEGYDYVRYSGVRRDESQTRVNTPPTHWDTFFDCELHRPLCDWTKGMCFAYVEAHGETVNPLYRLGFSRVGCAPCINSSKEDIRNWYARAPEMIDKIRTWEAETNRTFFSPVVPGMAMNSIDDVVAWAHTTRGGKEPLPVLQERPACESKYGLCA
jgi:3'-phosphoadenosine 5'-phosphosulfate sulfotransferase (PAPS reductase)/FAD synthetase